MWKFGEKSSRRAVLRRAALAIGIVSASAAAGSLAGLAQAPAGPPAGAPPRKQTKEEAAYQDRPNGQQRCGVCANFIPPNDCNVIQRPVEANGWCRNFRARV